MPSSDKRIKTQTFIGSSSEGLVVANAIKANLHAVTECHIWTDGVFLPGRTFIETLESMLDRMDYAILIATPDDMLRKRDVEHFSMRDNVLLELGMFMAKLGRSRTYLLSPRDTPIHIPSDLLGLMTVNYNSPTCSDSAVEALRKPCEQMRQAMQSAEKELSAATKRTMVKRLLKLTNQIQGFAVTLQSESIKSLMDRSEFERIRAGSIERLTILTIAYEEDAAKLGLKDRADCFTKTVLEAMKELPFPEEATLTQDVVVSGILAQLSGGKSVKDQIGERFEKLTMRYVQWWQLHGPRIFAALNGFQSDLIGAM